MTIRIGILGAARIAPNALVKPARTIDAVTVAAVAARDRNRAEAFAANHGIPRTLDSYDELLADPDIDAVYNPLPNGLHGYWTIKAIAAGKHVLCEKPFTANADEAKVVADAAAASDRVVMEAFHYRYHPVALRLREIVEDGSLGDVQRIETWVCFPLPRFSDIRYDPALAGGAFMDAGCYAVHLARFLGRSDVDGEPEVVRASAKLQQPDIDRALSAELRFPSGVAARVTGSLWSANVLRVAAKVTGSRGRLYVLNPVGPQFLHFISQRTGRWWSRRRFERLSRRPTYAYQLDAFAAAVDEGAPIPTGPDDSIANMTVIDACYRAAGLEPRQPTMVAATGPGG